MGTYTSFYVGPMIEVLSTVKSVERYFKCPEGHKKLVIGDFCPDCGSILEEHSRVVERPFNAFVFQEWGLPEDELYQPALQGDENCLLPNRDGYGWSGKYAGDTVIIAPSYLDRDIEKFEKDFAPYIDALKKHNIGFVVSNRALVHAS